MISYPILLSCVLLLFIKYYYLLKSITSIVSYMTQYHSFTISGAVNISIIDFDKMNYGVMLYFFSCSHSNHFECTPVFIFYPDCIIASHNSYSFAIYCHQYLYSIIKQPFMYRSAKISKSYSDFLPLIAQELLLLLLLIERYLLILIGRELLLL